MPNLNYAQYLAQPQIQAVWNSMSPQDKAAYSQINPTNPALAWAEDYYNNIGAARGDHIQPALDTSTINPTALNVFGTGDLSAAAQNSLTNAANMAGSNPNSSQVQAAQQAGQYQSAGTTSAQGTQQQTGVQQGQTNMNQNVTGTNQQAQQGATASNQVGSTTGTTTGATTGTTTGATTGTTTGTNAQNVLSTGATTGQTGTTGLTQQQTGTQGQTTQNTGTTNVSANNVSSLGQTNNTTQAIDTLGLGSLLAQQKAGAQQSDDITGNFLQGLVQNGPAQQKALTVGAVNQALSGPGMVGAGDNARARAAGYAGQQVGLNSLNQQLEASRQLGGPTAVTTLAQAGVPYLGQQQTGLSQGSQASTGTSQGTQATTGSTSELQNMLNQVNSLQQTSGTSTGSQATTGQNTQNTAGTNVQNTAGTNTQNTAGTSNVANTGTSSNTSLGSNTQATTGQTNSLNLNDLLSTSNTNTAESQAGTSGNTGVTVGGGHVPENTQQQSGGCFATTAYVDMGWKMHRAIRKAAAYKLSKTKYRRSLAGYSVYGPALARLILFSGTFALLFFPVARAVLYEELRLAGVVRTPRKWASLCHLGFHYGSLAVAVLTGRHEIKQCDKRTVDLLSRNNLLMEV